MTPARRVRSKVGEDISGFSVASDLRAEEAGLRAQIIPPCSEIMGYHLTHF